MSNRTQKHVLNKRNKTREILSYAEETLFSIIGLKLTEPTRFESLVSIAAILICILSILTILFDKFFSRRFAKAICSLDEIRESYDAASTLYSKELVPTLCIAVMLWLQFKYNIEENQQKRILEIIEIIDKFSILLLLENFGPRYVVCVSILVAASILYHAYLLWPLSEKQYRNTLCISIKVYHKRLYLSSFPLYSRASIYEPSTIRKENKTVTKLYKRFYRRG